MWVFPSAITSKGIHHNSVLQIHMSGLLWIIAAEPCHYLNHLIYEGALRL